MGKSICAALLGLFLCSGCAFVAGVDDTFAPAGRSGVDASDWRTAKVYFRGFANQSVTGRSTTVASGGGVTVTASSETVGTSHEVPDWILDAAASSFPFASISPTLNMGSAPTYILEGSLKFVWDTQWWSWVQLIDIWIHAFFAPTLGRYLDMNFNLALYDADHTVIRRWTGKRVIKYVGQVWWLFSHGGADASGFEEDYQQCLRDEFTKVGEDMRQLVAASGAGGGR
jgi:hypothetical protein